MAKNIADGGIFLSMLILVVAIFQWVANSSMLAFRIVLLYAIVYNQAIYLESVLNKNRWHVQMALSAPCPLWAIIQNDDD